MKFFNELETYSKDNNVDIYFDLNVMDESVYLAENIMDGMQKK